jgi:hypothetical protein
MDKLLNIETSKTFSSVSEELALIIAEPTRYGEYTTADDLSVRLGLGE